MMILHLSDLHFQVRDEKTIRSRWNDLIKKLKPLKLDVIIFTGDLINRRSDTKNEDIALSTELFSDLITRLEISDVDRRVIFIAGNHDLPYDPFADNLKNKEKVNNERSIVVDGGTRVDDWYPSFLKSLGLRSQDHNNIYIVEDLNILSVDLTTFLPHLITDFKIEGFAKGRLGTLCDNRDKLLDIIKAPIFDDSEKINVFVTHYPPSELSPCFRGDSKMSTGDTPYNLLKKKFDLYLCGHIHGFELFEDGFVARVGGTGGKFSAPPYTAEYALYEIDIKNKSITSYRLTFDTEEQAVLELVDGRNPH